MTNDKAQAKPSPNVKAQMTNQAQNPNDKTERITITCPHPSPLQQVERGVRRGRGKQESRSRDERLHIAGFCDDAALKLKRTLNGKSSMLLREHNPIDNSVTGDTITVQGSRV